MNERPHFYHKESIELSVKAIQSEYPDASETIELDEIASRGNKSVEASFIKEVHDKLVSNGYTFVLSTNVPAVGENCNTRQRLR